VKERGSQRPPRPTCLPPRRTFPSDALCHTVTQSHSYFHSLMLSHYFTSTVLTWWKYVCDCVTLYYSQHLTFSKTILYVPLEVAANLSQSRHKRVTNVSQSHHKALSFTHKEQSPHHFSSDASDSPSDAFNCPSDASDEKTRPEKDGNKDGKRMGTRRKTERENRHKKSCNILKIIVLKFGGSRKSSYLCIVIRRQKG